MVTPDGFVELVELDVDKKWELLRRYYQAAGAFFQPRKQVVEESEIRRRIRDFKERPRPVIRKVQALRDWRFVLDQEDDGTSGKYFSYDQDETSWEQVRIPHSFRHVKNRPSEFGRTRLHLSSPGAETYPIWRGDYTGWYKTRVPLGEVREQELAHLSFESVNLISSVWANEVPVMMDHYGLFPFEVEITEELLARTRPETVFAVKVTNIASNLPYLFSNGYQGAYHYSPFMGGKSTFDFKDDVWAGIAGDVLLSICNKNHIGGVFVVTRDLLGADAVLECQVDLTNATWDGFRGTVVLEISKWLPMEGEILATAREIVSVRPMNDARADITMHVTEAERWSPDTPNLYLLHAVLIDEAGQKIDDVFETFGIRTITIVNQSFYLNGRKTIPRGCHGHCALLRRVA